MAIVRKRWHWWHSILRKVKKVSPFAVRIAYVSHILLLWLLPPLLLLLLLPSLQTWRWCRSPPFLHYFVLLCLSSFYCKCHGVVVAITTQSLRLKMSLSLSLALLFLYLSMLQQLIQSEQKRRRLVNDWEKERESRNSNEQKDTENDTRINNIQTSQLLLFSVAIIKYIIRAIRSV